MIVQQDHRQSAYAVRW